MRFDEEIQELRRKIHAAVMKAKIPSAAKLEMFSMICRAIADYQGKFCEVCILYYDTPECPRCHGTGG